MTTNSIKTRSYMMDELGDPDAPIGSKLWCMYVSNEIRKTYYDKTQLGARLKNLVEAFSEHRGWQELGFFTWEAYCEKRLQVTAERLDAEAQNIFQLPGDPVAAGKYLAKHVDAAWMAACYEEFRKQL